MLDMWHEKVVHSSTSLADGANRKHSHIHTHGRYLWVDNIKTFRWMLVCIIRTICSSKSGRILWVKSKYLNIFYQRQLLTDFIVLLISNLTRITASFSVCQIVVLAEMWKTPSFCRFQQYLGEIFKLRYIGHCTAIWWSIL